MTVDEAIRVLPIRGDLDPLKQLLETGRGYSLEEFCENTRFKTPKLTEERLLGTIRSFLDEIPQGSPVPQTLRQQISKATGPTLAATIERLGGKAPGKVRDRRSFLLTYLSERRFPEIEVKPAARSKSAVGPEKIEELTSEFLKLKDEARSLSLNEIDSRFDAIFDRRCTVPVIKGVLKKLNYDATGTKAKLLEKLRRIPHTLAGDRARESFI